MTSTLDPPFAGPAEPGPALPCPYPDCVGAFSESELVQELCVCDVCRRVAARCPRHGRQGRCRTLNRPLARFCRHCRQELDDGWAQACWARDLDGDPAAVPRLEPSLDQPERAQWVLCLDDFMPPGHAAALLEVAGRLWVGAGGHWLLADPFSDMSGQRPLVFDQLWPGGAREVVRARAAGLWLVLYSQYGVKAAHLLALDDPRRNDYRPLPLWQPGPGEELLTDPVLLRTGRHAPERTAAWLAQTGQGLTLFLCPLRLADAAPPSPTRYTLEEAGRPLTADDGRAVLLPVALPERDGLLLATAQGVWLLTPPAEPAGPATLPAQNVLRHPQLLIQVHEMPGVVVAPAEPPAPGPSRDAPLGTLFVAGAAATGGEELCAVLFARRGPVQPRTYRDPGGVPLGVVTAAGRPQVLCWAGANLFLCDLLGQQTRLAANDLLASTLHAQVHGRLLVSAGRDAALGQARWFAQLFDLRRDNGLVDVTVRDAPLTPPVLLGRHLFAVEQVTHQGRPRRWLTRRHLVFESR